jgi:hypothetical protein
VFERVRRWLQDRSRERAAHHAAWTNAITLRPDRYSAFQHEAERRVLAALALRNLAFAQRTVHHAKSWDFIVAEVPELRAQIWFYDDQVDVQTPAAKFHHEYWDVPTPDEYLTRLEPFLGTLPSGHLGDAA